MNKHNFTQWLMAGFFILACHLSYAQVGIADLRIPHPSGSGEMFHGGVYYYNKSATNDVMGESHIRRLAQAGLTHFYVATTTTVTASDIINWCHKYNGRYASFQHDWLVGNETPAQLEAQADSASSYIGTIWNSQEYLASCVKEEPPSDYIDTLFTQYALINSHLSAYGGVAPIYLLLNSSAIGNLVSQKSFKPLMLGYDGTYLFRWIPGVPVYGYEGYLCSPSKALDVINDYLDGFTPYVDSSIQWPVAVISGNAQQGTYSKSYLLNTYGQDNYDHYLRLAQYNGGEGNQGFKESGDNILYASFYVPPTNCISCQTWLAIARGYRAIFVWSCDPNIGGNYISLMGSAGKGSPALNEYTKTIRQLQKYGWLINRMQYQPSTADPYLSTSASFTYTGQFNIPGYSGRVAVLVNSDVATWSGTSPELFHELDVFRISSTGIVNDNDYIPKTAARTIPVTNMIAGAPDMYDLETGTKIGNGSGTIAVLPGKGKLIFIGNAGEMADLRAKCGMTTITAHTGLVPDRETIPTNLQERYPVDPLIASSGYNIINSSISLNKRYRVHVTAKSSDGAKLGVDPAYYSGGIWNTSNIMLATNSSLLWNTTLTSTPTTFVSRDFTVTQGTAAMVFLYRSNEHGTIQIDDYWIEDCSSHRQVDTEWTDNSITHTVANGETYQIYVRARNYPGDSVPATLSVKIGEYDAIDNFLGEYTAQDINGETLSEQPTVFKGTFQKNNPAATKARLVFLNASENGTLIVESACVGKIVD